MLGDSNKGFGLKSNIESGIIVSDIKVLEISGDS